MTRAGAVLLLTILQPGVGGLPAVEVLGFPVDGGPVLLQDGLGREADRSVLAFVARVKALEIDEEPQKSVNRRFSIAPMTDWTG